MKIRRKLLRLAKKISRNRKLALHEVSQWYMRAKDMALQIEEIAPFFAGKKVVFLGDGDGISILLAIAASKGLVEGPTQICVLDIDERELDFYSHFASKFKVNLAFSTQLYNVFDKLPEQLRQSFEAFYINPPYSSATNPKGLGFTLWLERCLELCSAKPIGCVVHPIYDNQTHWIGEVEQAILDFAKKGGYKKGECVHYYHGTQAISANLFITSFARKRSKYHAALIPRDIADNLYHNSLPLPHYIFNDGSKYGKFDYNW